MESVFIGIPTARCYMPFWDSFYKLLDEMDGKYEYELCPLPNRLIADARNEIAEKFLASEKDYLLFLDDDHTGHSLAMFEAALAPVKENKTCICAIQCYTKVFPHFSNLSIYSKVDEKALGIKPGTGKYIPIDLDNGYFYLDLVGFGLTVVSRQAFQIIERPYFIGENNTHEDNYFCDKLIKAGNRPIGCFDYVLDHAGIGRENARFLRQKGLDEIKAKYPDMKVLVS